MVVILDLGYGSYLGDAFHGEKIDRFNLCNSWFKVGETNNLSTMSRSSGCAIKCRRLQFPPVDTYAPTIHISQGGTFSQIMYNYHKEYKQQLCMLLWVAVVAFEAKLIRSAATTNSFTRQYQRRYNEMLRQ